MDAASTYYTRTAANAAADRYTRAINQQVYVIEHQYLGIPVFTLTGESSILCAYHTDPSILEQAYEQDEAALDDTPIIPWDSDRCPVCDALLWLCEGHRCHLCDCDPCACCEEDYEPLSTTADVQAALVWFQEHRKEFAGSA